MASSSASRSPMPGLSALNTPSWLRPSCRHEKGSTTATLPFGERAVGEVEPWSAPSPARMRACRAPPSVLAGGIRAPAGGGAVPRRGQAGATTRPSLCGVGQRASRAVARAARRRSRRARAARRRSPEAGFRQPIEEEGHSSEQQRTPGGEGLGQQGVEAERLEQFGAEVGIHGRESAEARRAQRLRAAALRCEDFFLPAPSSSFAAVRASTAAAHRAGDRFRMVEGCERCKAGAHQLGLQAPPGRRPSSAAQGIEAAQVAGDQSEGFCACAFRVSPWPALPAGVGPWFPGGLGPCSGGFRAGAGRARHLLFQAGAQGAAGGCLWSGPRGFSAAF